MTRAYTTISTTWGHMFAVWSERGLWELSFPRATLELAAMDVNLTDSERCAGHSLSAQLAQELSLYFRGIPVSFTVPIDWRGYTPFQAAVLKHTASLGYGQRQTYGEVACAVGSPRAARAVGGALHINRTPIVVPCHRIVGANGSLTGFGGGLELKRALLLLEAGEQA